MKAYDPKAGFKKATSIFVLGVTLVLGASALTTSEAQAAAPWDNNGSKLERRDNGDQQKAFEKRQKEIQKKREAEAKKRREMEKKNHKKRPPFQQNNDKKDRPQVMPWQR
ncbi:hypothetical protein [Acidaminococcus timonensis]|jgi:hypothetical protein|uniref:hypothetical protein n=1 Tax=Acidaminococcus TaxID=904 RepID=UPI0025FBC43F|nr:hypothetical protein [Acidaminococcus timonensis]MDD6569199.1 hypothetical protein [Acidaminococcus sp.]